MKTKIQTEVENRLANRIREYVKRIGFPDLYYCSESEKMDYIQNMALLINELLSGPNTENKFEKLANTSIENGKNNKEKYQVFRMLRNLLIHFPFFENWDDIYINENLLDWNKRKGSQIKKFFKDNENKELNYSIYMNRYGKWEKEIEINIKIPKIYKYKKIYLKDILTIDEAMWTFCIIDYYLDQIGYKLDYNCIVSA